MSEMYVRVENLDRVQAKHDKQVLELKLELWRSTADMLQKRLQDIFDHAKAGGEVVISNASGTERVKLVRAQPQ